MRVECFELPGKKINTKTNIKSLKELERLHNYKKKNRLQLSYDTSNNV